MKKSDEIMILAVMFVVVTVGVFVFGFGIGVVQGREEYKNKLHKQLEEHNQLLKEYVALLDKIKEQSK